MPLHKGLTSRASASISKGTWICRAFLGLSEEVRPGYEGIRLTYRVKSDAPREKIEELCRYVQKTSPVLDIVRNPVPCQHISRELELEVCP